MDSLYCRIRRSSTISVMTSITRTMREGLAWNDPEIGIKWPQLTGEYQGSASAAGYELEDGTKLNLSEKDQMWLGLRDTFRF